MLENSEFKKCKQLFMDIYCLDKMLTGEPDVREEDTYCWVMVKGVIPYA